MEARSSALPLLIALLIGACGCGGAVSGEGPDAAVADASMQEGSARDVREAGADARDAGTVTCAHGTSPSARIPKDHRAASPLCPSQRAASPPAVCGCPSRDGGQCGCADCLSDSECDAGVNGRCGNPRGAPFNFPICSYDECTSDTDCPTGVPCACRASASDNVPNVCWTGGNCQLDSDCGSGGYCSPSLVGAGVCQCEGSPLLCPDSGTSCSAGSMPVPCSCGDRCGRAFYCHTACDECTDDSDCNPGSTCNYDILDKRWECGFCAPVP